MTTSVYDAIIGQDVAVQKLRALAQSSAHAYMFVGPSGSGKDLAARAFVATKLQGSEDSTQRVADLVMRGIHVDVHEVERVGAAISITQAREEIAHYAMQSPVEASHRVVIAHDFHLLQDEARSALLKTIEEPHERTLIVLLLDDVPEHLVTIASRCVRVDFRQIPDELIVDQLLAAGVDRDTAVTVAHAAGGDVDRARLLADDPELAHRMNLFARIPARLDGTASRVLDIVSEIFDAVDTASAPLEERHQAELTALADREKSFGERGSGRKKLQEQHARELRRLKTDEFRTGLRLLTIAYGDALRHATDLTAHHQTDSYVRAVKRIRDANVALSRNVNERLLMENLLLSLPTITPSVA